MYVMWSWMFMNAAFSFIDIEQLQGISYIPGVNRGIISLISRKKITFLFELNSGLTLSRQYVTSSSSYIFKNWQRLLPSLLTSSFLALEIVLHKLHNIKLYIFLSPIVSSVDSPLVPWNNYNDKKNVKKCLSFICCFWFQCRLSVQYNTVRCV